MPFIPAPAKATRIVFAGTLNGEEVVNVCHSIRTNAADITIAKANLVFGRYADAFVNGSSVHARNDSYRLVSVTLTDVQAANGLQVTSTAGAVNGVTAGVATPNSIAECLTLRTANSGRSFRGRIYLPGVDMDWLVDDNHLTAATQANLQTAGNNFIAGMIAEDFPLAIASYFTNLAPRALAVYTAVTAATANSRLDSQRRRMPRA